MPDFSQDQFKVFNVAGREFKPYYTPEKLIDLGVFNGAYFELAIDEDFDGLRQSIYDRAIKLTGEPDPKLNAFGVRAGLDYGTWIENGWIFEEDPLGWFHWYCRFISGRRHHRDAHQVGRWLAYARWYKRALAMKEQKGKTSAVINQGLLHWSWPVVV